MYLWAFVAQGFGVGYTNVKTTQQPPPPDAAAPAPVTYGWTFSYDADNGWISSGFKHSPSEAYLTKNTHGPVGTLLTDLPTGLTDFGWIFALGGLGIALTFGLFSRIAGWGGFALNMVIWFAAFPPSTNPDHRRRTHGVRALDPAADVDPGLEPLGLRTVVAGPRPLLARVAESAAAVIRGDTSPRADQMVRTTNRTSSEAAFIRRRAEPLPPRGRSGQFTVQGAPDW